MGGARGESCTAATPDSPATAGRRLLIACAPAAMPVPEAQARAPLQPSPPRCTQQGECLLCALAQFTLPEWMLCGSPMLSCSTLHKLYRPYNGEDLVWHPVTKQMNKVSFQVRRSLLLPGERVPSLGHVLSLVTSQPALLDGSLVQ